MEESATSNLEIKLTFKGQSATVSIPKSTTAAALEEEVRHAFSEHSSGLLADPRTTIKLLYKGKVLGQNSSTDPAFPTDVKSKPVPKVVVMATSTEAVTTLNAARSDPLIRGFDDERRKQSGAAARTMYWGPQTAQHRNYKFVKLEACTWQSFGHRPNTNTPHAFEALRILERLSTDPGVVAIMVERELVVNTLGEMDPIDDRLKQKKQTEGACLLGYNTNHGLRIDLKLRPDSLDGFLPYESIAATLIHELSHNWVGEHDALFWANYGQMRVEYLHRHAALAASGYIVDGRTTASLAGVTELCRGGLAAISENVQKEVAKEMLQHGVPIAAVAPAIIKRCEELEAEGVATGAEGRKLGGGENDGAERRAGNARELALTAAERRAKENDESPLKNDADQSKQ